MPDGNAKLFAARILAYNSAKNGDHVRALKATHLITLESVKDAAYRDIAEIMVQAENTENTLERIFDIVTMINHRPTRNICWTEIAQVLAQKGLYEKAESAALKITKIPVRVPVQNFILSCKAEKSRAPK